MLNQPRRFWKTRAPIPSWLMVQPELARLNEGTPLMWLPDDDEPATEAVDLLVSFGADPAAKNNQGLTAADYARKWALFDTADLLDTLTR